MGLIIINDNIIPFISKENLIDILYAEDIPNAVIDRVLLEAFPEEPTLKERQKMYN